MTDESIQQQMDELIHLLERYNREYYELDEPSVSDAESPGAESRTIFVPGASRFSVNAIRARPMPRRW